MLMLFAMLKLLFYIQVDPHAVSLLLSILFNSPFYLSQALRIDIYYQFIMVCATCLTNFLNALLLTSIALKIKKQT